MTATRRAAALLLLLPLAASASADEAERVWRVGSSGDYAPFSQQGEEGLEGFDVEIARRFASDQGWRLELVGFSWPRLLDDLAAGRFEIAMSGVTVRPERSLAGRFSVPVATSSAVALVHGDSPYLDADSLDLPGVRIAVNAGGHLERVARVRFPHATILAIPDNEAVLDALVAHKVDAAMTDDLEQQHWLGRAEGLRVLGPLSRDRKAYLWGGEAESARALDEWLLARERDGTLAELREEYLGGARPELATPLDALLAALDERLDLMPAVALAKRRASLPVHDPEREQRVIAAALASARQAAQDAGLTPLPDRRVRALFVAQIDAARAVQQAVLAAPPDPSAQARDLEDELRPALLRIGDRVAWLVVRLPGPLDPEDVERRVGEALDVPGLQRRHRRAIADAISQISRYRR